MEMTTITLILVFAGTLTIGVAKAYERMTGTTPESWDKAKFGIFVFVVGGIMLLQYMTSKELNFPGDTIIAAVMTLVEPIAALFGMAYVTILSGKFLKKDVVEPVVASIVKPDVCTPAPGTITITKPAQQVNLPDGGCEVTPSLNGKTFHLIYGLQSPVTIQFAIEATQVTADHSGYERVLVDWDDGTTQEIVLMQGKAKAEHTFRYIRDNKYTGKTFNPVFTFVENTGEKFVVNGDGRSIEIGVETQ